MGEKRTERKVGTSTLKQKRDAIVNLLRDKGVVGNGKELEMIAIEAMKNSMNKNTSIKCELQKLIIHDNSPESIGFLIDLALRDISENEFEEKIAV